MNVYDFDETLFYGDTEIQFVPYCWLHCPATLKNLPRTAGSGLLLLLRVISVREFKENVFHMLRYIPDVEHFVDHYVEVKLSRVKPWYAAQQKPDDLVISASPTFLISRFCQAMVIQNCLATEMDIHTGRISGLNCHDEEKVRRFYEAYPKGKVDAFYSDSRSDTPLARIASQAYLVKGDQIRPWKF